jgi:hypothetical protein
VCYTRRMPAPDVLLLSDLSYAESLRELTRRASGAVLDQDGLMLYAGPHPLPVLQNGVMRTDARLAPVEVVARADAFFAARRRGYSITVRAHADQDLADHLAAQGMTAFGESPGMILDRRLPDVPPPPGVTLRRVATDEDVESYVAVSRLAWATYGMPDDVTPAALGHRDVHLAPHIASFVAVLDGRPAAAAMSIVTHAVSGVYWVGTIPDARGRGLAEVVTRAAGNAGFDRGARLAALQASVMGEPVYRRMGYVTVTRYPFFVRAR